MDRCTDDSRDKIGKGAYQSSRFRSWYVMICWACMVVCASAPSIGSMLWWAAGLSECWNVFCFKVAHWHNILCQNRTWCLVYVILMVFSYRVQSDLHTGIDTDALCESSGIDKIWRWHPTLLYLVCNWLKIHSKYWWLKPNRNTQVTAPGFSGPPSFAKMFFDVGRASAEALKRQRIFRKYHRSSIKCDIFSYLRFQCDFIQFHAANILDNPLY